MNTLESRLASICYFVFWTLFLPNFAIFWPLNCPLSLTAIKNMRLVNLFEFENHFYLLTMHFGHFWILFGFIIGDFVFLTPLGAYFTWIVKMVSYLNKLASSIFLTAVRLSKQFKGQKIEKIGQKEGPKYIYLGILWLIQIKNTNNLKITAAINFLISNLKSGWKNWSEYKVLAL